MLQNIGRKHIYPSITLTYGIRALTREHKLIYGTLLLGKNSRRTPVHRYDQNAHKSACVKRRCCITFDNIDHYSYEHRSFSITNVTNVPHTFRCPQQMIQHAVCRKYFGSGLVKKWPSRKVLAGLGQLKFQ